MIRDTHGTRTPRRGSAALSTLVLALIAGAAAVLVVAGLILLRVWLAHYDPKSEFVYRRLDDTFGWPVILAPIGFTFIVLWIILLFRQGKSLRDLMGVMGFPSVLTQILLVWLPLALTLWTLVAIGVNVAALLGGFEIAAPLVMLILTFAPIVGYFVLLVLLSLVAICIDGPLNLIPLGGYFVIAAIYAPLAYAFKDAFSWWVILAPFMLVAFLYVALTYQRDAVSINTAWASFLGLCRTLVYSTLAFVFLLPGCQQNDITEKHYRVLVMFDVSGSMGARDGAAPAGTDVATLPTRQDLVIKLLTDRGADEAQARTFVERLLESNPVVCYRFGGVADKEPVFFQPGGPVWNKEQFASWLKFDKKDLPIAADNDPEKDKKDAKRRELAALYEQLLGATDISGSTLDMVNQESAANNVQAVIVFSDGQRNKGGDDALKELLSRASNPKRPMQIITVGVGDYREPVRIRLNPLRAPSGVRPDDGPFTVKVPVFGDGLPDQKFEVTLFVRRTKNREGKDTPEEKQFLVGTKTGQFKGGDHPFDEIEFVVNLEELTGVRHKEDEKGRLQGTWEFTAEIPRHPREASGKPKHVSDPPTPVLVLDKKLRVLLFASGPSRDYQFARNQFYREVLDKRMDLSIFLQAAGGDDVDQDVEGQRLLTRFPDKLGTTAPDDPAKYLDLKEYDVIISFDADWMKVTPAQMDLLKKWVGEHSGGLIFVGGPIHTDRLARPGGPEEMKVLEPLFALLPVKLNDSVLQGVLGGKGVDRSRPWPLHFSGNAKSLDFLKLDDQAHEPLAGWNEFFWGTKEAQPGKMPKRGFYSYHPVESVKQSAEIIATFGDPDAPKIMEGKYEMPYMVSMRFDKGKTLYIGSGELWRLRPYKEAYYERFLTKVVRYVSAGGSSKGTGRFSTAPEYVTGTITIEAEVLDKDGLPMRPEKKPPVKIIRPSGFDPKADRVTPTEVLLSAKKVEGRWRGIFQGSFPAETTGTYIVKMEIPGAEPFSATFNVRAPNLELGNLRTNFDHLQQLATEAAPVLDRLDPETRDKVQQALDIKGGKDVKVDTKGTRLFFKLERSGVIPQLLSKVPPERTQVKGKFEDLWDTGTKTGWALELHWVLMIVIGAIGLLTGLILLAIGRYVLGPSILGGAAVVVLTVFLVDLIGKPSWALVPLEMSTVLGVIVGLLSIEWLTRKLLKLA